MIEVLLTILVWCIVLGLLYWIVQLVPLPPPFKNVALVVVLLIGLVTLLGFVFGWFPSMHYGRSLR